MSFIMIKNTDYVVRRYIRNVLQKFPPQFVHNKKEFIATH